VIYMNSEINSVEFEAMRIMQSHLSKRFTRIATKINDTIYELLAKNESEILHSIEEKKNYEMKLKNGWRALLKLKETNAL